LNKKEQGYIKKTYVKWETVNLKKKDEEEDKLFIFCDIIYLNTVSFSQFSEGNSEE